MNLQNKLYGHTAPPFPLDYLNDIGEAIIRVEEKYCEWAYNNANNNQKTERVFAYELYHQFKTLTNCDNKYQNLRLDGEIGKRSIEAIELCGIENVNFQQTTYSPDLVIHLGQTNRHECNQKAVIEIKTKTLNGITGDLELKKTILKLNHYIRVFNFQYAIFLSVNTDFNLLTNQIIRLFNNPTNTQWQNRFKRIILINYKDRVLLAKTLNNILTNI